MIDFILGFATAVLVSFLLSIVIRVSEELARKKRRAGRLSELMENFEQNYHGLMQRIEFLEKELHKLKK